MPPFRFASSLLILILLAMSGISCAGLQPQGDDASADASLSADAPPRDEAYEELNYYYDFDDVLVPKDLKMDPNDSFVFETPQFKTGILKFNGRVDSFSLVDFFNTNLTKDGWKKHSSYKAKKSILVYEKQNKSCFISVLDESFSNTRVEILVVEMK